MTVVPPAPESSVPRRPPAQTERSFSELPPCSDGRPKIKNGHSFSIVIPGTLSNYRNLLIVAKNMNLLTRPVHDGGPAPGECGHGDGASLPLAVRPPRSVTWCTRSAPRRPAGTDLVHKVDLCCGRTRLRPRTRGDNPARCRLSALVRVREPATRWDNRRSGRFRGCCGRRRPDRQAITTRRGRRPPASGRGVWVIVMAWKSTHTTLAAVPVGRCCAAVRTCTTHSNAMPHRPRSTATTRQLTDRVSECPTSAQAETRRPASGPSPQAPCSVECATITPIASR